MSAPVNISGQPQGHGSYRKDMDPTEGLLVGLAIFSPKNPMSILSMVLLSILLTVAHVVPTCLTTREP